jgi:circadian clock protein KaiC
MMSDNDDLAFVPLGRAPTGLPGLDTILCGGLLRGGVYMFLAAPGSGKTIFANQICFHHVAQGQRALYVTLLTESHSRMLSSMANLSFFDATRVGAGLSYVSGYPALEKDKLKGLLSLLRQTIRDHQATLLVIDGFLVLGSLAASELETKKFIQELQVLVEFVGCTTLILAGEIRAEASYALRTMVDGLFELSLEAAGMQSVRTLQVSKFRGSGLLLGKHQFEITGDGVTIFPRTESHRGKSFMRPDSSLVPLASFGIRGLDDMLGGGLRSGSMTMVLGAPGSGKTLLGLSLLAAGADAGEPCLYFGFFETASELCRRADGIGLRLSAHVESGSIELLWQSPLEAIADALAERLLGAVRARGVKRLFIDGIGGFKDSLPDARRSRAFLGALCNELSSLGVVTVLSEQTSQLSELEFPEHGLTALLDTVIGLRYVAQGQRIQKCISLLKIREGGGDPSPREFSIDASGFSVSPPAAAGEGGSSAPLRGGSTASQAARRSGKRAAPRRSR